jgi:hypothetical protein
MDSACFASVVNARDQAGLFSTLLCSSLDWYRSDARAGNDAALLPALERLIRELLGEPPAWLHVSAAFSAFAATMQWLLMCVGRNGSQLDSHLHAIFGMVLCAIPPALRLPHANAFFSHFLGSAVSSASRQLVSRNLAFFWGILCSHWGNLQILRSGVVSDAIRGALLGAFASNIRDQLDVIRRADPSSIDASIFINFEQHVAGDAIDALSFANQDSMSASAPRLDTSSVVDSDSDDSHAGSDQSLADQETTGSSSHSSVAVSQTDSESESQSGSEPDGSAELASGAGVACSAGHLQLELNDFSLKNWYISPFVMNDPCDCPRVPIGPANAMRPPHACHRRWHDENGLVFLRLIGDRVASRQRLIATSPVCKAISPRQIQTETCVEFHAEFYNIDCSIHPSIFFALACLFDQSTLIMFFRRATVVRFIRLSGLFSATSLCSSSAVLFSKNLLPGSPTNGRQYCIALWVLLHWRRSTGRHTSRTLRSRA